VRGRTSEGAAWAAELQGRPDVDPAGRIVALGYGAQVTHLIDMVRGKEMAEATDALWTSTRAALPVLAIEVMSLNAMMRGDTGAAIAGCDRCIELAGDEPDRFLRATALTNCCAVLGICGDASKPSALNSARSSSSSTTAT
jgi:hypothetical protein